MTVHACEAVLLLHPGQLSWTPGPIALLRGTGKVGSHASSHEVGIYPHFLAAVDQNWT